VTSFSTESKGKLAKILTQFLLSTLPQLTWVFVQTTVLALKAKDLQTKTIGQVYLRMSSENLIALEKRPNSTILSLEIGTKTKMKRRYCLWFLKTMTRHSLPTLSAIWTSKSKRWKTMRVKVLKMLKISLIREAMASYPSLSKISTVPVSALVLYFTSPETSKRADPNRNASRQFMILSLVK